MKTTYTALIITLAIAAFVVFRIVLPFSNVFTDNGVQLNTVDAYYMARYAEMSPVYYVPDYYINYPRGNYNIEMTFPNLIANSAKDFGTDIMTSAAWLPPILFLLTLPCVYILCRNLFKEKSIALLAVFLATIIPGEFMHRTSLGAGDRHCFELYLFTVTMTFLIVAVRYIRIDKFVTFMSMLTVVVVGGVFIYTWAGGIIILPIIGIFLVLWALSKWYSKWQVWAILGFLGTTVLITTRKIMTRLPFGDSAIETQPLFFDSGVFDPVTMIMWFGLTFFVVLAGIGVLTQTTIYLKFKKPEVLLFLVWTMVMLILTILMRRWSYFLGINVAIITAFVWIFLLTVFKNNQLRISAAMAIAVVLPILFNSYSVATSKQGFMPQSWVECTQWLREQSGEISYALNKNPGYGAISHWNYGYWIAQAGRTPAYCTPGNHLNSRLFTSTDLGQISIVMQQKKLKYLIIDDKMMDIDIELIRVQPDLEGILVPENISIEDTAMYQLYNKQCEASYLRMVWQSSDSKVKVFENGGI